MDTASGPRAPEISVVIPVFNSEASAPELCQRLRVTLDAMRLTYEVIFVDDGSTDRSAAVLAAEAKANPAFRLVRLVRNFGQHSAITAGFELSRGRRVVLMDDDLQNPPEEIPKLYAKALEGYDDVHGVRERRRDTPTRRAASKLAHWLMFVLFGKHTPDTISPFRIMSRRVVEEYLRLTEKHTYVTALISWMGFPHTSVAVRHDDRKAGRSGYTFGKLLRIWLNIAFGFSERPLAIATWLGCISSLLALILIARALYYYFKSNRPVPGYTSLFVSQMLYFGLTMLFLGVLGAYLGRIYREVKDRPFYILDREGSVPPLTARRERADEI